MTDSGSEASKPGPKATMARFSGAMAKVLASPGQAPQRRTVLGFPMRTIVPIACGVVLIAGVAVALLFLPSAQNPPIATNPASPGQSAAAQPPRNPNADPSLILNPSELYQNRSLGFSNLGKQ